MSAPAGERSCPSCGRTVSPDDNFCEACRADLAPPQMSTDAAAGTNPTSPASTDTAATTNPASPASTDTAATTNPTSLASPTSPGSLVNNTSPAGPTSASAVCPDCPDAAVTADGYCESCGRRVPSGRDHSEHDLGTLAGVSDRGLRHHQNEDALAIAAPAGTDGPVAVAVVCDGVSSSSQPAEASLAATQAAIEVLLAAVRTGGDLEAASAEAIGAAQRSVAALAQRPGDSPSATFVSAVLTSAAATLCWLGDSRAYWLDSSDAAASRRLTTDDSLAEELVASGLLSEADAMASPHAHVVTRWVGADAEEAAPHVSTFEPPGPGVLMLCSDGLWNYRPDAADLAGLALPRAATDPRGAAADLVTFALEQGGHDNITVVLAPFPPPRPEGDPADEPA
jgi:serine/threonine protein phosphatase PrpC